MDQVSKQLTDIDDKFEFLKDISNWCNHRTLLLLGLENTAGPVLELGTGYGSTIHLHNYCEHHKRYLRSFDSNKDWSDKFVHLQSPLHDVHCSYGNWDSMDFNPPSGFDRWSVVFVDHAPGERRWVDIKRMANSADVIVVHDAEPGHLGYALDQAWPSFKYKLDHPDDGAWTSMVSNYIDVTKLQL